MKTEKGTVLPILNLKGKDYLEVRYRVVWFREVKPDWSIETEFLQLQPEYSLAKALIKDSLGRVIATAHKFETKQGFADHMEKAETGAIGRALALCGFGTANTGDDFSEGQRLVDSPGSLTDSGQKPLEPKEDISGAHSPGDPGEYIISFGRKYKGTRLNQIPDEALIGYMSWLEGDAKKKGEPLSGEAAFLKIAIDRYFDARGGHVPPPFGDEDWPQEEFPPSAPHANLGARR